MISLMNLKQSNTVEPGTTSDEAALAPNSPDYPSSSTLRVRVARFLSSSLESSGLRRFHASLIALLPFLSTDSSPKYDNM